MNRSIRKGCVEEKWKSGGKNDEYQPSGARATRSQPAKLFRMQPFTAYLIQNGGPGQEMCQTLGFWIKFSEVSGKYF